MRTRPIPQYAVEPSGQSDSSGGGNNKNGGNGYQGIVIIRY